jgi:hypothetical protein
MSPFEEGKYHYYVRVIDPDLQNGICVLVLVLVLPEVVTGLTVNEFYSFFSFLCSSVVLFFHRCVFCL